jgi:hypothetical protein
MDRKLLAIYLNDHLLGATVGLELVRRTSRENPENELGSFLRGLAGEIAEDRETLVRSMRRLDVRVSRARVAAGWTAEKVGRLKLNGRMTSYSPLSRLVELEGLAAGIEGKRCLWIALAEIERVRDAAEGIDFPELAERARRQREQLEPHRLAAAARAFGA